MQPAAFAPHQHAGPPADAEGLLIDRTLQGCHDAFADLVQPHMKSLKRFARMRLRSESEVEDVVQQSVLQALDHLRHFRREASFRSWLGAIVSNEISLLRRVQSGSAVRLLESSAAANMQDPSSLPDMHVHQRREAERLHRAMTRLPEKYRLLIQLRDLRELSIAETAQWLSLTAGAVKTRHHRARKLLRRALDQRTPGGS